jgi:hypothetical protein
VRTKLSQDRILILHIYWEKRRKTVYPGNWNEMEGNGKRQKTKKIDVGKLYFMQIIININLSWDISRYLLQNPKMTTVTIRSSSWVLCWTNVVGKWILCSHFSFVARLFISCFVFCNRSQGLLKDWYKIINKLCHWSKKYLKWKFQDGWDEVNRNVIC